MANTIKYKGKKYKTRTFRVFSEEIGIESDYTIADESLFYAISENDKYLDSGTKESAIDNQIYYYVEEGCLDLPAEQICKECLDIEFKLIEEIF